MSGVPLLNIKTHQLGEVWMQVRDARKLARIAVIQGISHRDIARHVYGSDTHSYVGRILRGEIKTVTPEAAARWANLYGVAIDDLFITKVSGNPGRTVKEHAA